jgi:hypothetical protein
METIGTKNSEVQTKVAGLISRIFKNRGYWSENFNKYLPTIISLFGFFISLCLIIFIGDRFGRSPEELVIYYPITLFALFCFVFGVNYFGFKNFDFKFKALYSISEKIRDFIFPTTISLIIAILIIVLDTNSESNIWLFYIEVLIIALSIVFALTSSLLKPTNKIELKALNDSNKVVDNIVFRYYLHHVLYSIVIGIVAFILYFAIILIPIAIIFLFNISDQSGSIYAYIGAFCFSFLAPTLFILEYKNIETFYNEHVVNNFPKIAGILLKFVLIPLVTIYSGILLVFSLQTLITSDFPEFSIVWLMISLLVPTLIVVFASNYFFKNKAFLLFIRGLLTVNLINLFTFFSSIFIVINNYGLTINRYLVVTFGVFLLLNIIYLLTNFANKFRFASILAIILMIIIFCPVIGAIDSSANSQKVILIEKLDSVGMLQDGKIVKASEDKEVSDQDRNTISTAVSVIDLSLQLDEFAKEYLSEDLYNSFVDDLDKQKKAEDKQQKTTDTEKGVLSPKTQDLKDAFLKTINIDPLYYYFPESSDSNDPSNFSSYNYIYYKDNFAESPNEVISATILFQPSIDNSYKITVDGKKFDIVFTDANLVSIRSAQSPKIITLDTSSINKSKNFDFEEAIKNKEFQNTNDNPASLKNEQQKNIKIKPKSPNLLSKTETLEGYEIKVELVKGSLLNYDLDKSTTAEANRELDLYSITYLITFRKI